jgi:hypothetical protein
LKLIKGRETISIKRIEELEHEIVKLEEEKVFSQVSFLLFQHNIIKSVRFSQFL